MDTCGMGIVEFSPYAAGPTEVGAVKQQRAGDFARCLLLWDLAHGKGCCG